MIKMEADRDYNKISILSPSGWFLSLIGIKWGQKQKPKDILCNWYQIPMLRKNITIMVFSWIYRTAMIKMSKLR